MNYEQGTLEVAATIGLGLVGFLIGNLLFSKVATWIATLYTIAVDRNEGPRIGKLAIAFFLSAVVKSKPRE